MKAGFLYVLVHPSDPHLLKVGVTTLDPQKRLAQHNRDHHKYAGRVVAETGQEWTLDSFFAVPDPYWAEKVFWGASGLRDIPFQGGIEVQRMERRSLHAGLEAAKKAGIRPALEIPDWVHAYTVWMRRTLEGRGITLVGQVRSKFGRASFRCTNGHTWRATPQKVAGGEGCPTCGVGTEDSEGAGHARTAVLCLLVHHQHPGLIKVQLRQGQSTQTLNETCDGWEVHRYRHVDDLALASALIWKLLGCTPPNDHAAVSIDLPRAEQAFRELIARMHQEIASRERNARRDIP